MLVSVAALLMMKWFRLVLLCNVVVGGVADVFVIAIVVAFVIDCCSGYCGCRCGC